MPCRAIQLHCTPPDGLLPLRNCGPTMWHSSCQRTNISTRLGALCINTLPNHICWTLLHRFHICFNKHVNETFWYQHQDNDPLLHYFPNSCRGPPDEAKRYSIITVRTIHRWKTILRQDKETHLWTKTLPLLKDQNWRGTSRHSVLSPTWQGWKHKVPLSFFHRHSQQNFSLKRPYTQHSTGGHLLVISQSED